MRENQKFRAKLSLANLFFMRLLTHAFSLKFSWVGFKKRKKKLALLPSACLFSVVSSPAFYGGWGIEGGLGPLGVAGETGRPRRVRGGGRGKTNVKAPNVLLALPFPVRPFIRSFSFE